jgi:DNA-binding MarR family transcriptional regulator
LKASKAQTATLAWAKLRDLVLVDDDPRKRVAGALGITYFKIKILLYLSKHAASASDLVERFASDKTYISLLLRDLEDDGSVVRATSPEDRRAKLITLTDQGHELACSAARILDQPPPGFSQLTHQELDALLTLIDKISGEAGSSKLSGHRQESSPKASSK